MRFVILLILSVCGVAQAQPSCLPRDLGGTGTEASITVNARGQAAGWWCPDGTPWIAAMRWSAMTDAIGGALETLRTSSDKRAAVDLLASFRDTPMAQLHDVWAPIGGWRRIAVESEPVALASPAVVRYGAGAAWVQKVMHAGTCSNEAFGDPARGVVKACEIAVLAGAPPAPPPPSLPPMKRWKVKANGLLSTRPAYLLTAGARGTREVGRAPVGATCDATAPTLPSGADLWAQFDTTRPGVVALCSLQP